MKNSTYQIPIWCLPSLPNSQLFKRQLGWLFDHHDNLYVLESHTHSPASGYKGPSFDLIKYGADDNEDGLPDRWHIFADSIEDGMNIIAVEGQGILLSH